MNGTSDKGLIQRFQVGLSREDNVGGVFCLHDTPVIGKTMAFEKRAISLSEDIQYLVQVFNPDFVRKGLSPFEATDFNEGVAF